MTRASSGRGLRRSWAARAIATSAIARARNRGRKPRGGQAAPSARQVEAHQRAFMQATAPNTPADTADASHRREAAIRPLEVVHARAVFVIGGDPSDARRFGLHAFR